MNPPVPGGVRAVISGPVPGPRHARRGVGGRPAVHPDLADGGVPGGDLVQELGAGDGVLHTLAVTSTASRRPIASVTMLRLRPTVFFPAPAP